MSKSREPLPSPLDAVQKMLETGTIGGGRARPPEPEAEATTGEPGALVAGQQDTQAPGQPGNMAPGQQANRAPGQRTSRNGWQPQTMYLPGDLRKWLKLRAVTEDREIGEIVAEAIQEYRARRG